ncbi:MAG: methyltransferase [bacterium]|nr:methyltransferase [bacterium]
MKKAAQLLKSYLDEVGFNGIFKYLSGLNFYYLTPARINAGSEIKPDYVDKIVERDDKWGLIKCLMMTVDVEYASLDADERNVADALIQIDFLKLENNSILRSGGYQLISYRGQYLFIDGRINYRRLGYHDVYIGFDTYVMLYYLEAEKITKASKCIDICTGSGVAALVMGTYSDQVVGTDIAEKPLMLSRFNCMLNNKEQIVTIRNEDFNYTLDSEEKFDFVTCNPPFVAFPSDLEAPIFARGYDTDGLGHYRLLFSKLKNLLAENGTAYFVSDFIGDEHQPYFTEELRQYAMELGLHIDLFIDNRLSVDDQIKGYPIFMQKYNPDYTMEQLEEKITHFLVDEIKAKHYYLSTLRVRANAKKPTLNIFKRYAEQLKVVEAMKEARKETLEKETNFFRTNDLYREYYGSQEA